MVQSPYPRLRNTNQRGASIACRGEWQLRRVQTPALLKADLAFEIYNIIEARKLTQAKSGELLGVDPSDISRLKQGDFNRFSVERLFTLLNRFSCDIEIRITPAEDREGYQRVVAI